MNDLRHHRDFRRLWAAQTGSAFGSRITRTAVPVIAVKLLHASPAALGLLSALSVGPGAVIGLFAGGPVDRRPKRPILVAADLLRAALVLSVPVAAWTWGLSLVHLAIVTTLAGAATTLFDIADRAYLPSIVGRGLLAAGNGKLQTTDSLAEIAGPGLAGFLIDLVTAPVAMIVDAASYVWSALLLATLREDGRPETETGATSGLGGDLRAGLTATLGHPVVRPLLLATATSTFFSGFFLALYMAFALDTLAISPRTIGLVIGVGGIGGLLGAIAAPRLPARLGLGPTLILALAVGQCAGLLIPLARGERPVVLACLAGHQLVGDGFTMVFLVHAVSLRQRVLPIAVQGRAGATFAMTTGLLLPAGALLAGAIGSAIGVRATLWIGMCGGLASPLFLIGLRDLRE
ncbi:MAG: MFS transporter [Acidobacteriota bacterium]